MRRQQEKDEADLQEKEDINFAKELSLGNRQSSTLEWPFLNIP